ncbi:MAG: hypothetical protein HY721_09935 [Planctomycetes bacterium]|nr:hypothetical protein [Planctomycetota bacterium]
MGLDTLELVLKVEERFGVVFPDDELASVRTVGDLHGLVLRHLEPGGSAVCLSSRAFYRVRTALEPLCGRRRRELRPGVAMEALLPRPGRRRAWASLSRALSLRLPELELPPWLVWGLVLGFLTTPVVAFVGYLAGVLSAPAAWALGLGALPGLWLAFQVTAPFATRFPEGCETLGGAAKALLSLNFRRIAEEARSWREAEAWQALVAAVVEQSGVAPEKVTRHTRFVEDLRLD